MVVVVVQCNNNLEHIHLQTTPVMLVGKGYNIVCVFDDLLPFPGTNQQPQQQSAYTNVVGTPAMAGSGSVIMIYGLTPGRHNCDHVFNLLCSYGNVLKVHVHACGLILNASECVVGF